MQIIGAHHTSYTVIDMTATLEFYCDMLGFKVINERSDVTNCYFRSIVGIPNAVVHAVLLEMPGTQHRLELLEYKRPKGMVQNLKPNNPGSSHVCYVVDDLKTLYEQLTNKGIEFISDPVYLDEGPSIGGWSVYLKDPSGILIELMQPPS